MWLTREPIDHDLQSAYLRRLGVAAEPPSFAALQELHRRQVERIPYETMWIHVGEAWDIDPHESVARVALQGRGGYCYHLNGAFGELLRSLGYDVRPHIGGVHGPNGPDPAEAGNHLVLTVRGLPTYENPSGTWYLDAGLGDALHDPLPLAAGAYVQEPFRLVLDEPANARREWHLTHDPAGGFTGMSFTTGEATLGDFIAKHQWLSTSPDSGFVQLAMAERRDATGIDVIRGLVLTRVGEGAQTGEALTNRDEWFAALADVFDLRFDAIAPEARDRLWDGVLARHRAWETRGGQ